MNTSRHSLPRRLLAAFMAFALTLGPLTPGALAATTALTDQPLAAKVAAKPNLIYTLDDSGSMSLRYIPDYVTSTNPVNTPPGYCRHSNGTTNLACGTDFQLSYDDPMYASEFNRLWYNPTINYEPPADGAGNQANLAFPNGACGPGFTTACATTYKLMNSLNTNAWVRVPNDMYLLPPASLPPPVAANTSNLTTNYAVRVFCNTDWPAAAYVGPTAAASVWPEVGDVYGENSPPSATVGADCRINGTYYAAVNGAPETLPANGYNGYNYPWQRSSLANDPKYFWRNQSTRQIWCDRAAAGWPKTTQAVDWNNDGDYLDAVDLPACPWGCTLGGTPTSYGADLVQSCVFVNNTVGAPYTYTVPAPYPPPAVGTCETDPLYQWSWAVGGCVGTIGVECMRCDRTGTITAKNAKCSITQASCGCAGVGCTYTLGLGNAACPDQPNPQVTGCTVGAPTVPACNPLRTTTCNAIYGGTTTTLTAPTNPPTAGSTLLDDSNNAGTTCRHNQNTGTYVSTRFTYPSGLYAFALADASCGTIPTTVPVPPYYYTAATVEFCNTQITQASDPNHQWRGFGKGLCQAKNDQTTYRFVKYGAMTRVALVSGRSYPYIDQYGVASSRTFAEEMTNYATWFAYYRTRILAAKTTSAIAFNIVDNTYRVGFHSMNLRNVGGTLAEWLDINDFTPAQRTAWYAKLFAISIGTGMTPTIDATYRIGEVVKQGAGAVAGLPVHTDPIPTVAGNPVTCTNNYHILFTDGETNQLTLPAALGEVDGAAIPARSVYDPATFVTSAPYTLPTNYVEPDLTRTLPSFPAGNWPRPYRDAASPTPNSLADITLNYWMTDLRPTMKNDVPWHDGRAGKDLDWKRDPAWWQHVSFSAISFGSDGLLDSADVTAKTDQIGAGTANWFTAPNYPRPPNRPNVPVQAPATRPATAIDDLWHATVNARGTFVYAESPLDVAYGLGRIISGIGNNQKARVGAAFAGQSLRGTNNFIFEATIEPGWSGELKKVTIDTVTGVEGAVRWSAATKLDALLATPAVGTSPALDSDNAWFLNRRIVTKNTSSGNFVPFLYAQIAASQLATLATTATQQQKIISYLRGGSTYGAGPTPSIIEGVRIGQFRTRTGKLGNISDSKPVVVGPPDAGFLEANDYGYAAYKAAKSARPLRVYVGANDGMFHVFDGTDDSGPNTGGTEVFAYIPSSLFNNNVDDGGRPRGLRALTFQDGGAPIFKHHFYVNASARWMDVDFANCGAVNTCTPDWRTIVVGGLGKGGNTYFAIDATNTNVATEADAAAKILWEYSLPASQFSYGRPIIAKTRAHGWVVVIASGYNNTDDGKGHIYFLRASDGTLLKTLNTTGADTGSVGSPSGLAQISGFTKDLHNQIIEQIYGGDLNGRLWRWDVSDADSTTWQAKTQLLANLVDSSGVAQPVTTAPQIEIDINNGVDRFVFIGTGRLLDPTDLTTPSPEQQQTMYAIRDGTLDTPSSTGLPIAPRTTLASAAGVVGVGAVAPNGWYSDLPVGQRIINDVLADLNLVGYAGTAVQPDPCLTSLPAYLYARDYTTAESLIYTGGVVQPYYFDAEGAVGMELVALDSPTSSFPELAIVFTKETNASIKPIKVKPKSFGGGHRLTWRMLGE